jgi:hypothetical protein
VPYLLIVLVVLALPAAAGQWTELSPATSPPARSAHTMTTTAGEVYLFGGSESSKTFYDDLWTWDSDASTWVEIAKNGSWPPGRSFHSMVTMEDKILIANGFGQSGVLGDYWLFDPVTGSWQEVPVSGPEARYIAGMAYLGDGQVFVAGGYPRDGNEPLDDAWILDFGPLLRKPDSEKGVMGTQIASLPYLIYGLNVIAALADTASMTYGSPFTLGGWAHQMGPTSAIYRYCHQDDAWYGVTPMGETPRPRALAAQAAWRGYQSKDRTWGDVVLIFGGESADKARATADVQIYDTLTNMWTYGDSMLMPLSSQAAAILPPSPEDTALQFLMFGGVNVSGDEVDFTFLYSSDVPFSAATTETQWIAASAHTAGVGDTLWLTDLEAHNRGATDANVTVSLLVRDQANPNPAAATFEVEAGTSVRHSDVLDSLFSLDGAAALRLDITGGDVLVTSRTYNQSLDGTYGQFIAAVPDAQAKTAFNEEARLIQLSRSSAPETGFRTNIGFVNLSDTSIELEATLYDGDGPPALGTVSTTLQVGEYQQHTDIFTAVGGTAIDIADGYAVVTTTTEGGRFLTYASVVDNATGDPTYITPVQPMTANGGCITATAHASGVGDTEWRSTLQLHADDSGAADCTISLLPRDQPNPSPLTQVVTVDAGSSLRYEDVLDSLFGFSGTAALLIEPDSGELRVTSRTFNQGLEGTYGQLIPLAHMGDAVSFGEEVRLIQLTSSDDPDTGYRTNIGWVNVTGSEIVVEADLYDGSSQHLGGVSLDLDGYEYRQFTDVYSMIDAAEVADGFAVVRTITEGGTFFTYASVVDKATGDPIYIPGM